MRRLLKGLLVLSLSLAPFCSIFAQFEKEAGKTLFKNVMTPSSAGPGKVAFFRADLTMSGFPIELYVGDIATGNEKRILPGRDFSLAGYYLVAFSPDGSQFVIPEKVSGSWELILYRTGSREGTQISKMKQYAVEVSEEEMKQLNLPEDVMLAFGDVYFSPSGKRLIFTLNRFGKSAVWWLDPATGRTRQATEDLGGYCGFFHPNDDLLCYTAMVRKEGNTADEDICVRSITTGEVDTLTHSKDHETQSCFSPDGKYIAYVRNTDNINNIWVMNYATRKTMQFTFVGAGKNCIFPSWSNDGKKIFFQASGFYEQPAVMVRDFQPM